MLRIQRWVKKYRESKKANIIKDAHNEAILINLFSPIARDFVDEMNYSYSDLKRYFMKLDRGLY